MSPTTHLELKSFETPFFSKSKELQQHTQQGFKWTSRVDVAPSQTTTPEKKPPPPPAGKHADLGVEVTDFDNRSSLLLDNASGSGDDAVVRGTGAPTPEKITTEAQVSTHGVNQVPSADSAYMAYLSEIYSSLSAMEQKVRSLACQRCTLLWTLISHECVY